MTLITIRNQGNVSRLLFILRDEKPEWYCEGRERCDYAGSDTRLAKEMTCCVCADDTDCTNYCALYYWSKPVQLGETRITPSAIRVVRSLRTMKGVIKIQTQS